MFINSALGQADYNQKAPSMITYRNNHCKWNFLHSFNVLMTLYPASQLHLAHYRVKPAFWQHTWPFVLHKVRAQVLSMFASTAPFLCCRKASKPFFHDTNISSRTGKLQRYCRVHITKKANIMVKWILGIPSAYKSYVYII